MAEILSNENLIFAIAHQRALSERCGRLAESSVKIGAQNSLNIALRGANECRSEALRLESILAEVAALVSNLAEFKAPHETIDFIVGDTPDSERYQLWLWGNSR